VGDGGEELILEVIRPFGVLRRRALRTIRFLEENGGSSQVIFHPLALGEVGHRRNPTNDVAAFIAIWCVQRA
jgi:hypothetical protein